MHISSRQNAMRGGRGGVARACTYEYARHASRSLATFFGALVFVRKSRPTILIYMYEYSCSTWARSMKKSAFTYNLTNASA